MDDWIPETARAWNDWLLEEERKTVAAYREKPAILISDFHGERGIARDYEGREILELLQNANDQAAAIGSCGRVLIELSASGLIVANTGLPFSTGGVASLQTSHYSPKRHRRKRFIGNKGLGFRAVLNWSSTPIILSGNLSLAYCRQYAREKVQAIIENNAPLARLIEAERQTSDALILPLLPFPLYSVDGNLSDRLDDEPARTIFQRCEVLLIEGYDTVIGMPFDTASGCGAAAAQIEEIGPEILLFVKHLVELEFHAPGKPDKTWRREGDAESVRVFQNEKPIGNWRLYRRSDELPEDAADSDQFGSTEYEVVIAVPQSETNAPGVLFSHFPTEISLPLPVVCHGTFELEQNRKHIQQDRKCNRYVLGILADFLAEIAEEVACIDVHRPWAGCDLVMPRGEYSQELKRERFPDLLIAAVRARKIVPTLSEVPVTSIDARSVEGASSEWLPPVLFREVVPVRDAADARFLLALGIAPLEIENIKGRIIASPDLPIDRRVALIQGLLKQPKLKEACTSALFLDYSGDSLGDGMRVFLSPSTGAPPSLPIWVDLRFLNHEMRLQLAASLRTGEVRELHHALSGFGLREYSLGNLIQALVAAANRYVKVNPIRAASCQTELLRSVFDLYLVEDSGKKRPDYPDQSPIYFLTQAGSQAAASSLYLGVGFGARGDVTQALYGNWAPEKLLMSSGVEFLHSDIAVVYDFLVWVGVAEWPRDTRIPNVRGEYVQSLLRAIKYPAAFEDKVIDSGGDAHGAYAVDVNSVDGLEQILLKASPDAIAAWLARDDRAIEWGRPARKHGRLFSFPQGVFKARSYAGDVLSYVRWSIETTAWLRSKDAISLRPKDCVLGERTIEELFPRPLLPNQDVLERFNVNPAEILEGWRRAGVLTSLAYLERDEIYAKLLELPIRSPDGKLARPLYQWLLDASDVALGGDGPNQKEFLTRGKMWGQLAAETRYFPISELHHADSEGLPDALLLRLKIVDLRKRVGSDKVEKLFAVKAVDRAGIQRRIISKNLAVGSSDANAMFESAKPYLHRLRLSDTKQLTQLQALRELRLEVCSTFRIELAFEDTLLEYDVPTWGWMIEDKVLYVRSDPARPLDFSESLLSNAICEALASVIFRIADGGDFARMLSCRDVDRLELLRRLRGDTALEDLDAIKADYLTFNSRSLADATFPLPAPPKLVSSVPATNPPPPSEPASPPVREDDGDIDSSTGPLLVDEIEHVPVARPVVRKLQVRTIATATPGVAQIGGVKRVTDGDFCEQKAMEFEEACEPPRWPILVSHVMGAEGPGCDVFSFESESAREAFVKGPTRDMNSVLRFIEVKGRGAPSVTIELKGNELSAAERYGDRYFLYRLYESEEDTFQLSILRNPLNHKEALIPAVHVGLDQAAATQRFSLSGGVKPVTSEIAMRY